MNLREIDRLVATKVMEWKIFTSKNVDTGTVSEFYDDGENLIKVSEWSPTLDIQDAWQVVEKLKDQYFLDIYNEQNRFTKKHHWGCQLANQRHVVLHEAKAETAPLAICLAALKACGIEVEDDE